MMTEKKYVKPKGEPGALRPIAIVLWVLGLVFEVFAILTLLPQYVKLPNFVLNNSILWLCIALVVDFILVVTGSFLWKRANKIDPPSEKNKTEFFIKTQLGAIISVVAFLPILILVLTDKNMDKKAKGWVSLLVALCLVGGSLLSADFNPISLEDLQQMEVNAKESEFGSGTVRWSKNSKVYHTWADCHAYKSIKDENEREGLVKAAFEAGKARMCYICAEHFNIVDGVENHSSE